jgi:putative acetyltransferase
MLLFIGGAARTGKGILVRRLVREQQLPYLSLDVLKMGLTRGVPEYDIDPNAGGILVAERLWPLVREMSRSLLFDQVQYVIEGEILPKNVAALQAEYPTQVHACFLGYPLITPAQKLHDIRTHAGHPNDWPQEYTDSGLLPIILREIAFSQYLRAECAQYHLPYFDMSTQFVLIMDQVAEYVAALRDGHE